MSGIRFGKVFTVVYDAVSPDSTQNSTTQICHNQITQLFQGIERKEETTPNNTITKHIIATESS